MERILGQAELVAVPIDRPHGITDALRWM